MTNLDGARPLVKPEWSRRFMPDAVIGAASADVLWDFELRKLSQVAARTHLHLVHGFELASATAEDASWVDRQPLVDLLVRCHSLGRALDHGFDVRIPLVSFDAVAGALARATPLCRQLFSLQLCAGAACHAQAAAREPDLDSAVAALLDAHFAARLGPGGLRLETKLLGIYRESSIAMRSASAELDEVLGLAAAVVRTQCNLDVETLMDAIGRSLHDRERAELTLAYQAARQSAVLEGTCQPVPPKSGIVRVAPSAAD